MLLWPYGSEAPRSYSYSSIAESAEASEAIVGGHWEPVFSKDEAVFSKDEAAALQWREMLRDFKGWQSQKWHAVLGSSPRGPTEQAMRIGHHRW